MNTPTPSRLPELSDARLDVIEEALFADIAAERTAGRARRVRRGRAWWGAGAAAAVVVVAALIAPAVGGLVSPAREDGAAAPMSAPAVGGQEGARDAGGDSSFADLDGAAVGQAADQGRDVIASGSATVVVDDVRVAVRQVGDAAVAAGGVVESTTVGESGLVEPLDGGIADTTYAPAPADGGWVTVRVPSDRLTGVMDRLADVGEVTASSTSRLDVTDQTVDLRARIDAAQVSVDRLTALLAASGTVGDLIAAESALAERQATLESYQQQLESLDGQIEMSALSVSVLPRSVAVAADPAGFGDGLAAGWNGLIAALNGIVVALGFLIPWLVVLGVAALIVWGVVRVVRARRPRPSAGEDAGAE